MDFNEQNQRLKEMETLCRELLERIEKEKRLYEALEVTLSKHRTQVFEAIPIKRGQA